MQTHLVSKIMHQNLAINLWQFNYGKNSFAVLVPGGRRGPSRAANPWRLIVIGLAGIFFGAVCTVFVMSLVSNSSGTRNQSCKTFFCCDWILTIKICLALKKWHLVTIFHTFQSSKWFNNAVKCFQIMTHFPHSIGKRNSPYCDISPHWFLLTEPTLANGVMFYRHLTMPGSPIP